MKIYCQFAIFGPGKLRKRSLKVLEFFWAHGVQALKYRREASLMVLSCTISHKCNCGKTSNLDSTDQQEAVIPLCAFLQKKLQQLNDNGKGNHDR